MQSWFVQIDNNTPGNVAIILVGTKSDLPRAVDEGSIQRLIDLIGCKYVECSAKDDVGVNEVFEELTKEVMDVCDFGYNTPRCVVVCWLKKC